MSKWMIMSKVNENGISLFLHLKLHKEELKEKIKSKETRLYYQHRVQIATYKEKPIKSVVVASHDPNPAKSPKLCARTKQIPEADNGTSHFFPLILPFPHPPLTLTNTAITICSKILNPN